MAKISLDTAGITSFVPQHELDNIQPALRAAHNLLKERSGPGSEFLGWLDLPEAAMAQVEDIQRTAEEIQSRSDALVVIGIGGSYLGARAAIEALGNSFHTLGPGPRVFFAGHNLSSTYHADLLDILRTMDFSINVISKSGTTTEPAIAFRVLRGLLEEKYGREEARRRIYVTTDAEKGALRTLVDQEGYKTFVIPNDVGGRYSVLTPVGLLPMAVAGIDIKTLIQGAAQAREDLDSLDSNPCYQYAALRNILYKKGKRVELLAAYEPGFQLFTEWWKQLFGESEGKEGKGIFPAAAIYSTDLHSLGQYIQDGPDILFETVLKVEKARKVMAVPRAQQDLDQLNYLAGKDMDFVNDCAFRGTFQAHVEGGVPNIVLELPDITERTLGYLFYFMEKACAVSGYMLGVNPFDQPGVEAYKRKMFSLLGKPS